MITEQVFKRRKEKVSGHRHNVGAPLALGPPLASTVVVEESSDSHPSGLWNSYMLAHKQSMGAMPHTYPLAYMDLISIASGCNSLPVSFFQQADPTLSIFWAYWKFQGIKFSPLD